MQKFKAVYARMVFVLITSMAIACSEDAALPSNDPSVDITELDSTEQERSILTVLPDGSEMTVPKAGALNSLLDFLKSEIEDSSAVIACDRISFQPGSSEIDMAASSVQLENLATVLQTFRTDSAVISASADVDVADNPELAKERSQALVNELIMLGVDGARLKTRVPLATTAPDVSVTLEVFK